MNLFEFFDELNWLGVVIATIAAMAWGTIYYLPQVAGTMWGEALGIDMRDRSGLGVNIALEAVTWFVAAIALGLIARASASDEFASGIVLGLVTGVGVNLARAYSSVRWEKRSSRAFSIGAVGSIISFLIVGVLVSIID